MEEILWRQLWISQENAMNLHKHHLFIPSTVTTNTQKKKKWWLHFWKLDIFKFVPFIQDLGAIIKKHIYWCRATYLHLFVSIIKYQQNSIHFVRSSFTNVIEFTKTCPDGNHFQSPGDKYQATGRHNSAALKWKKNFLEMWWPPVWELIIEMTFISYILIFC